MIVGRVFAWLVLALAGFALVQDAIGYFASGRFSFAPLGQFWYSLHPFSLNLVQAVVERRIHPFLWDPILISILQLPAFAAIAIVGLVFAWMFRKR